MATTYPGSLLNAPLNPSNITTTTTPATMTPSNNPINIGEPLTPLILRSLQVGCQFNDNTGPINALDFDPNGEYCVSSSEDESLILYDCRAGRQVKSIFSKKYGCSLVRFAHRKNNVIYASTKEDDTIRFLSFHDNKYIRYFRGHQARVTSLEMHPTTDTFLSAAVRDSIRLWDLRTPTCQGYVPMSDFPDAQKNSNPLVAFDPAGLIFAVATAPQYIRLYDARHFERGPFNTFKLSRAVAKKTGTSPFTEQMLIDIQFTSLKFSNDGKCMVISSDQGHVIVIDAFDGSYMWHTILEKPVSGVFEAQITPDAQYVFAPNGRNICFWYLANGEPIVQIPIHMDTGAGSGQIGRCLWNPKYMMMACGNIDGQLTFVAPPPTTEPADEDTTYNGTKSAQQPIDPSSERKSKYNVGKIRKSGGDRMDVDY